MIMRSVLAIILSVSMASAVLAAGSTSPSRRSPPTGYDLGVKAVKAGDYARALSLLQKVVNANPRDANAWNFIGFSHRKLNRFDQALAAYKAICADFFDPAACDVAVGITKASIWPSSDVNLGPTQRRHRGPAPIGERSAGVCRLRSA